MKVNPFTIPGALVIVAGVFISSGLFAQPQYPTHGKDIERLKTEIAGDPKNTELLMELAKLYGWEKDLPAAVETYEKVLAVNPDYLEARKKLVDFYSWVDKPGKSAEQIEVVLKREPDNAELMGKLANRYARTNRQKEAEAIYQKILEKDPGNVQARKGLADISRYSSHYDEAVRRYRDVLRYDVSEKEKLDVYEKVADSYYYAQDYGRAREYAQEALRLDPHDEVARERLRKIDEKFKPRVFNEFRDLKLKGDSHRVYNNAGFIQPTQDFTVTGTHKRYRWYHGAEADRYGFDAAHVELSKYLGEGLTLAVGAEAKFYNVDKARFDYYVRAVKDFVPGVHGDFLYEKETMDSEEKKLEQRVDRHSLSATYYANVNDWMTLNWNLGGSYYTKGNAFSDNASLTGYVRPIFHISKEPVLDLSYLYYRIFTFEKDRNPIEQFEYFSPRVYDVHAVELYYRQDLSERWTVAGGDTVSRIDEGDFAYTKNTYFGELTYKFGEDRRLSVRYLRGRHIHNASPTDYKDQELRVYFIYKF